PPCNKVVIDGMHWHFDAKTCNWSYKGKTYPVSKERVVPMTMMKVILVVTKMVELPPLKKLHHQMDTFVEDFNTFSEA
ncbi:hypothetical protein PanWU01x14_030890, partial [Parasponia andersonii]